VVARNSYIGAGRYQRWSNNRGKMQAWAQANAEAWLRPRASRASAQIEDFILQIKPYMYHD